MTSRKPAPRLLAILLAGGALVLGGSARAQVTPAAGSTPPDDAPSFKVGVMVFTDYTYADEPTTVDADGNTIHPAAFNVTRAYINVTGTISHGVSFRITPDIKVDSTAGDTLNGSNVYRLKYAYGQFNLDDRWTGGSWVRLGLHHTPYIDWEEGIYRYRFQGSIFVDREGFMGSSDYGLSTHYNFPANYGDVHGGYYNGDTYTKVEVNDQQAIQIRATLRPVPGKNVIRGLRLTAFYDADNYARNDVRKRFIYAATFEHKYVNAGFEHLDATDQTSAAVAEIKARGYSIWVTPRSTRGWEGLLRYDHLKPDRQADAAKERKIAGIAYWFHGQQASATAAILLDCENVTYHTALAKPDERRYAVHTLFNF